MGPKKPKGVLPLADYEKAEPSVSAKCSFKIHSKTTARGTNQSANVAGIRIVRGTFHVAGLSEKEKDDWITILNQSLKAINNVSVKYGFGGARVEYSCFSKVIEAKLADKEHLVDSYGTVFADKVQKGRTEIAWKTSGPIFSTECEFDLENDTQHIIVQLKDHKKKKDNVIGQVAVPLTDLEDHKVHDNWFKMTPGKTTINPTGHLKFTCAIVKNKIKIENLKGTGLTPMDMGNSADPFVVITCGPKKEKTPPMKKTLEPFWNKSIFTFDVEDKQMPVIFEIFHDNRDSTSDFMGEVRLTVLDLIDSGGEEKAWPVQKKLEVGFVGDLRIAIQIRKSWILPDKNYDDLFGALMQNNMSLTKKLATVSNKKEKPIAECLVKAFEMRRSAVHYIKTILTAEIETTTEPNVIFRGNTVATKSVDMYMRLTGMPYLHHILKPIVAQIVSEKKRSCELDEYRLEDCKPDKKAKVLNKNLRTLAEYVSRIFQEIQKQSLLICPTNFRNIFEHIQTTIQKKWPDHPTAQYTSVAGFIFLRFFCPALISPKQVKLTNEDPGPNNTRDLTLIAKTLQNLANLVVFGKKEPFMHPANGFIQENMGPMKAFLNDLCKPPEHAIDEIPSKRDILHWGREMARVHFHLEDNLEALQEAFGKEDEDLIHLVGVLERLRAEQNTIMNDPEYRKHFFNSEGNTTSPSTSIPNEFSSSQEKEANFAVGFDITPPSQPLPNSPLQSVTPPGTPARSYNLASSAKFPFKVRLDRKCSLSESGIQAVTETHPPASFEITVPILVPTPQIDPNPDVLPNENMVRLYSPQLNNTNTPQKTPTNPPPNPFTLPQDPPTNPLPDDFSPTNPICPGCFAPLSPSGPTKIALKQRWHSDCFRCASCKIIINTDFVNHEGAPRCLGCHAARKTCVKCGLELSGNFLNLKEKGPYHEACFTCHFCKIRLNDQVSGVNFFYPNENEKEKEFAEFICDECNNKKKMKKL